jgi:hypothetical protein
VLEKMKAVAMDAAQAALIVILTAVIVAGDRLFEGSVPLKSVGALALGAAAHVVINALKTSDPRYGRGSEEPQ